METKLFVDSEVLLNKIELLKIEKEKLRKYFDNVRTDSLDMINYWSGDSGDQAYEVFSGYTKKFRTVIEEIESKIKFLENVEAAYKQMDLLINQKMEENAKTSVY